MYIDVQKVPKIRNGIESMNRMLQKKPETRSPPCPSPEASASLQPGHAQAVVDSASTKPMAASSQQRLAKQRVAGELIGRVHGDSPAACGSFSIIRCSAAGGKSAGGIEMVEHDINHDARDRDVKPDGKGPFGPADVPRPRSR